ncbi:MULTISPECIES: CinA family protein [Sphingobacterium]|uniref:CinA C-terminal domain-containing protein n=1 Tax=Sphingobacterium cellulitidis TaxID=1768011 RepID=A0A8H9KW85_9SPHI|nr:MULTISPECIES: nicotinamide-nucleotide amidohydrolase family protein [Sphingobacterium]MBA8987513.1 PncC family amidohydrolase [Sphingobacterium soli]OYD41815.1 hypothetical protein CHT99_11425 [Sphingobacterium cellulitidis]WFB63234.1 nicotinamide-nucleotide amidohydrolase family protein [Sphingobacterium sp. WM]GGE24259.1 hypothetical protein GCM10011516_22390 [Sphingobacterium soli]
MKINEKKLNRIGEQIKLKGYKMSLAESMPAGFFTSIWSLQTESGNYLHGSIVCYAEKIKKEVLKVPGSLIDQYSAESKQVTEAMLVGLAKVIPADIHIAVTGKAFSDSEENSNSIRGDVFLCISCKNKVISQKFQYSSRNAAHIFISAFNTSLDILESLLFK